MSEIENYRVITNDEKEEIERLSNKALDRIGRNKENQTKEILAKINSFIGNVIENPSEFDLEELAFEFGCLYGMIFVRDYNWSWYNLKYNDSEDNYFTIASADLKVAKQPINYFFEMLKKERSNNFILGYNMIEKQYPKDWKFMIIH